MILRWKPSHGRVQAEFTTARSQVEPGAATQRDRTELMRIGDRPEGIARPPPRSLAEFRGRPTATVTAATPPNALHSLSYGLLPNNDIEEKLPNIKICAFCCSIDRNLNLYDWLELIDEPKSGGVVVVLCANRAMGSCVRSKHFCRSIDEMMPQRLVYISLVGTQRCTKICRSSLYLDS
jgi:hypothetical protein